MVDELGFDWLLASDHLVASGDHEPDFDGPIFEAWQLVAAWAAITKHVHLGVMVSGVMLRHPALIAKMAVTLDHLSGGRAICGLGAGWFGQEADMYGIPWPSRDERLARVTADGTPRVWPRAAATRIGARLRSPRLVPQDGRQHRPRDLAPYFTIRAGDPHADPLAEQTEMSKLDIQTAAGSNPAPHRFVFI